MSYARSLRSLGFARFRLEAASAEPSSATASTAEAATATTEASATTKASTETATAAAVSLLVSLLLRQRTSRKQKERDKAPNRSHRCIQAEISKQKDEDFWALSLYLLDMEGVGGKDETRKKRAHLVPIRWIKKHRN